MPPRDQVSPAVDSPLGRLIDHDNAVEEDRSRQPYQLRVVCHGEFEKHVRVQIVQRIANDGSTLCGISSGLIDDNSIVLTTYLLIEDHALERLERLVGELSVQPEISAVHWQVGAEVDLLPNARSSD